LHLKISKVWDFKLLTPSDKNGWIKIINAEKSFFLKLRKVRTPRNIKNDTSDSTIGNLMDVNRVEQAH
jgi:hypothetical protein